MFYADSIAVLWAWKRVRSVPRGVDVVQEIQKPRAIWPHGMTFIKVALSAAQLPIDTPLLMTGRRSSFSMNRALRAKHHRDRCCGDTARHSSPRWTDRSSRASQGRKPAIFYAGAHARRTSSRQHLGPWSTVASIRTGHSSKRPSSRNASSSTTDHPLAIVVDDSRTMPANCSTGEGASSRGERTPRTTS